MRRAWSSSRCAILAGWTVVTAAVFQAPASAAGADTGMTAPRRLILVPADLGATAIDVSGYPAAYQATYRELVVTKCGICHSPARALNAPYLELSEQACDTFKRAHPALVTNADVLFVAPHAWRSYIKKMWRRPPCCNLCPTFTRDEAEAIWQFLVYDSIQRKTGEQAAAWQAYRRGLIERFQQQREEGS